MPRKPTATDAQLILKLYDLRREAEMRKARNFMAFEFSPKGVDDVLKVVMAFGTPQNAWFRQALSYWEMAANLALQGTIHPQVFLDNAGELFFFYVKLKPFLKGVRQAMESPEFLAHMEKVCEGTPAARKKTEILTKRMARWQAMREAGAKAS